MDNELGRNWKKCCGLILAFSMEEMRKIMKNLSQDSQCPR
jgi:hypothetical protein